MIETVNVPIGLKRTEIAGSASLIVEGRISTGSVVYLVKRATTGTS